MKGFCRRQRGTWRSAPAGEPSGAVLGKLSEKAAEAMCAIRGSRGSLISPHKRRRRGEAQHRLSRGVSGISGNRFRVDFAAFRCGAVRGTAEQRLCRHRHAGVVPIVLLRPLDKGKIIPFKLIGNQGKGNKRQQKNTDGSLHKIFRSLSGNQPSKTERSARRQSRK